MHKNPQVEQAHELTVMQLSIINPYLAWLGLPWLTLARLSVFAFLRLYMHDKLGEGSGHPPNSTKMRI